MDPDLGRFPVVWAAAGTPTAVFPVPPATLRMLANAHVAPIAEERRPADVEAERRDGRRAEGVGGGGPRPRTPARERDPARAGAEPRDATVALSRAASARAGAGPAAARARPSSR